MLNTADPFLQLADWRRRIAEIYAEVRAASDSAASWNLWRTARERLFLNHPQSALPSGHRDAAHAPRYFDYDPAARVLADFLAEATQGDALPVSAPGEVNAKRIGSARFVLNGAAVSLGVYWLQEYSGGLFVSFRDATSGTETYGAGRYLLDTAKGADLGMDGDRLILDFNFAYEPSCSYDPQWSCPLAPRENWVSIAIRTGERKH